MGDLHRDLVLRACRWLSKTERCTRVFAEVQSMKISEFPDAIGYRFGHTNPGTIVVEAKASVADFKRDEGKSWKQIARLRDMDDPGSSMRIGMGTQRYYIVPWKMVQPEDVPDDHGLLYVTDAGKVLRSKAAPRRPFRDTNTEMSILCTMLQRYELGLLWLPDEYRFETRAEFDARQLGLVPVEDAHG